MTTTTTTLPELADGERYLCGLIRPDGSIVHSILLPGDSEPAKWEKQMTWAASIGGDLLSRIELAIAFAEMPGEFKKCSYWSGEANASESCWAWYQYFDYGYQSLYPQSLQLRARAVRRLII